MIGLESHLSGGNDGWEEAGIEHAMDNASFEPRCLCDLLHIRPPIRSLNAHSNEIFQIVHTLAAWNKAHP